MLRQPQAPLAQVLADPNRVDPRAWSRIGQLVGRMIRQHPLVQPILERHQIQVFIHEAAIWAQVGYDPERPGYGLFEVKIEHPRWWDAGLDTSEDWARRLTVRLAKGLRERWDATS